jgi:hypothetical protein
MNTKTLLQKATKVTKGILFLRFLGLLLLTLPASGADQIVLTVTVTNGTLSGDYLTVNGSTRVFTNGTPASIATWISSSTSSNTVTTNLYEHLRLFSFANTRVAYASSNVLTLTANPGTTITATAATNWCTLSLATNAITDATSIRVPMSVEAAALRTNLASQLVSDLSAYSTNAMSAGSTAASQLVGLTNVQAITGVKTITSPILISPVSTNGVNKGNAFSSPGIGTASEQFGAGALATNSYAMAAGYAASAYGTFTTAIGTGASATNNYATAIGSTAKGYGNGSIALGYGAMASGLFSVAIGQSTASHENSITIGAFTSSTAANQITLGAISNSVVIPADLTASGAATFANLTVSTNAAVGGTLSVTGASTLTGAAAVVGGITTPSIVSTNTAVVGALTVNSNSTVTGASIIGEQRYPVSANTSMANGANAAVALAGKSYVKLSGPTAAWSIAGIAGGADGRIVLLENGSGKQMSILHESGLDSTAGNRIQTDTGTDLAFASGTCVSLVYNATTSRWKVATYGHPNGVVLLTPEWDDVRIPMASTRAGAAAASAATFLGTTRAWEFAAATEQSMEFELQTPHGLSTNNAYGLRLHLHWAVQSTTAAPNTNVVWGLEYAYANPNTAFPSATTTVLVTNGLPATNYHALFSITTVTNIKESGVMVGRIYRAATSASDTHTGTAFALSLDAHYPRIRFGSTNEMGDY